MTTPWRLDRAVSIAGAVLRPAAHAIVRLTVYLGPLLLAAAGYAWRLLVDAAHGTRVLWLRYRARKTPERAGEFDLVTKQLRDAKAARWDAWRGVPVRRRLAVQTTVLAILVAIAVAARARYPPAEQPATDSSTTDTSLAVSVADVAPRAPALAPTIDLEAAAARVERDARTNLPGQWTFLTEGPVLAPGTRGDWDGFTIASPWVLKEVDHGATRYRVWYRGCYFRGRDRGCAIGHATSADGLRWRKTKGPVFEPADPGERRRLHGVTVVRSGDRYFLWYSVTPELFGPRKPSTLHLVTSPDGLRWEAAGQVLATTERGPHAMEPSALHDGRQFHLWFLDSLRTFEPHDYELQAGAPFLMHFTSADGRTWQESGRFPLKPTGLGYIRAVVEPRRDGGWQAIGFANSQLVRFVSSDGNDWDMDPEATTTIEPNSLSRDVWSITDATALESEGGTLAWFVTQRQSGREEIRVGLRKAK